MDKVFPEKKDVEELESIKEKYPDVVNYYNGISEGYDELHFSEQVNKFKILKEYLLIPDDSKVLDVGCGTFFSHEFFPWNLYGIEPSQKMVNLFLEKHKDAHDKIVVGFADSLVSVYGEEVFDAVICVSVAHHFKHPVSAFNEISKVCKPFGKIGITLLRNTSNFHGLEKELKSFFNVLQVIDLNNSKDVVFICMKK